MLINWTLIHNWQHIALNGNTTTWQLVTVINSLPWLVDVILSGKKSKILIKREQNKFKTNIIRWIE